MVTKSASVSKSRLRSQAKLEALRGMGKRASNTRTAERLILVGLGFGAVFWVFQSIVDVVLFDEGSLVEQLLTPGLHDLWMRTLVICALMLVAVYARPIITERKQTNEALRESTELAQGLMSSAGTGIYIIQDGRFEYANCLFQDLTGYTQEELIGRYCLDFVHPEDGDVVREKAVKSLKGQQDPQPYEYRLMKKNGDIAWVLERVTSIEYRGKRVAVGSVMDITKRKEMEEALRQSEERYRTILKEMRDGYYEVDLAGSFTFVNDSACRYLGYSRDEMMGMNYRVYTVREDVESVFKVFNQVYRTSEPVEGFSWRATRKDGTQGFAEASVSPLRTDEGQVVGFRCVGRDVTEREQAEDALRQSEERYRTVLENIEDGYFEVDLRGNYTFFNDSLCRMLAYSRDEMMGMNYRTYTPKKDVQAVFKAFNAVYRTGKPIEGFSWPILRKDGSRRFGEVSASPLRDPAGSIVGFRGINRDITERKRAEVEREALLRDITTINRKLQQSNKELQDFAYVASHDLREPLRKISSFGTLLQDSLQGKLDEDEEENCKFMIDGAGRMQAMIDALLTYSRVATKAKPPEQVDLCEVIEHLKKLELAARLDESNGAIHVLEPLPPVNGDPSQIHQLLQNLIGNGLKFQREGIPPEITVRAYQVDSKMVRVEVQDNGIGIDKEHHEQVFTMFKRLHSRQQYEGMGIGLAVCKKIVDRHGGEIGLDSAPGEGSTFWFTVQRGSYSGINQSKK